MSGFNRGFDVAGDLALSDNGRDFVIVEQAEKVRQNLKVRAQIFKGSWRYDRTLGVPYFQDILAVGSTFGLVRRRFYDLVAQTDGVLSVQDLTVRFDGDASTVFVEYTCVVDTGEVIRDVLDFVADDTNV